jgi:hypothetical protein
MSAEDKSAPSPPSRKDEDDCVVHDHPVPPEEMTRYTFERDPDAERDIANYVAGQTRDEIVHHVEKVKVEYVMREPYEIWDVVTDKNRWWVLTNITNLYSQKHFPSLDYTLSFHVGLMMRMRSRPQGPDALDPHPFDELSRRHDQADMLHDRAVEPEDYQAVGMQLRECLLVLSGVMQRETPLPSDLGRPQAANFIAWMEILLNNLCPGEQNKTLRQYLKSHVEKTWQLVNWLTHTKSADKTSSQIALNATSSIIGSLMLLQQRVEDREGTKKCPVCSSRKIRSHYDIEIGDDGDYYETCATCGWSTHPGFTEALEVK